MYPVHSHKQPYFFLYKTLNMKFYYYTAFMKNGNYHTTFDISRKFLLQKNKGCIITITVGATFTLMIERDFGRGK